MSVRVSKSIAAVMLVVAAMTVSICCAASTQTASAVTFTPSSLTFASQTAGTSTQQGIAISNTSNWNLRVQNAYVSGSSAFKVSGWSSPVSLYPSQKLNLTVTFAPTAAGSYSGLLNISTNRGTYTASVAGTATAPASAVSVSVSPATATDQVNLTQQFSATVSGTSNTGVMWAVNGTQGGNSTVGTISSAGLYTAPASVPATNPVTVTATSAADNTKKASASVTIVAAPASVSVSISPTSASVQTGGSQQFTASVGGTTNTALNWLVNGVQGGNSTVGFISTAGLYTGPTSVPANPSVAVTAQSVYDSSKSASASVTVTQGTAAATGTVYYVDSVAGSDSNTGISSSAPWRTLSKVNSSTFAAGDQILFKRGGVWNGILQVPSSGAAGKPLTFSAYGTGNRPVIDGTGVAVSSGSGLVVVSGKTYVTLDNLEIRNSVAQGLLASNADGFALTNSVVHDHQQDGVYVWASNSVLIDSNEVYNNDLVATSRYRGIVINGSGTTYSNISVTRNKVHDNHGGTDWSNCSEGIYFGNTGTTPPTFHNLVVADNELYLNGNPAQNQNGRGLTGSFNGDITILRNYIHDNASAGAYIGDTGRVINILYQNNVFKNNHLRGFGWMSDGVVKAYNNTIISNDPNLTGLGIEYATVGTPPEIKNNIFWLVPNSRYGSFYAVHVGSTLPDAGHNIYWDATNGPGSRTYLIGDYSNYANYLTFSQWVSATHDTTSMEINPQLVDPYAPDFRLQSTSPAINMGLNLGTTYQNALDPRDTTFPFSTVNQNAYGAWETGAFAYIQ